MVKKNLLLLLATNKHRYFFAATLFIALLIGTTIINATIQDQLRLSEIHSATTSATLSLTTPSSKAVVDLPYHLLQKASIHYFGLTTLAIKLPSLIIGILVGAGIVLLLRRWLLRSNIALFTSLIAITNGLFLSVSGTGTPLIMGVFWTIALLTSALALAANHRSLVRLLLFTTLAALSLYSPLSIYLVIGLLVVVLLHPHFRHLLKTIPRRNITASIIMGTLLLLPLIFAAYRHIEILPQLIGWPQGSVSGGQIKYNLALLAKSILTFWNGGITPIALAPAFSITSFCLIIFGGITLTRHLYSARSYALLLLFPLLCIPVILQPERITILFIPCILVLAIGIEALLNEWYKLFPHNPYARVVALAPLIVLLSSIIISNVTYYENSYRYSPELARYYTKDLTLLRGTLTTYPKSTLLTTPLDKNFYGLLKREFPEITVTTSLQTIPKDHYLITASGTGAESMNLGTPTRIVTDFYKDRAPRFYVYRDASLE